MPPIKPKSQRNPIEEIQVRLRIATGQRNRIPEEAAVDFALLWHHLLMGRWSLIPGEISCERPEFTVAAPPCPR